MSWGTDVLLLLNLNEVWDEVEEDGELVPEEIESEALSSVDTWLTEHGYGKLINLDEYASKAGNRAMLALVYGGAFNRLDEKDFIRTIKQQNWHSPENV